MPVHSANRRTTQATAVMLLLSLCVFTADRMGWLQSARMITLNAISPGRMAVAAISAVGNAPSQSSTTDETERLQDELLANELQRRQLIIENATLQNQLRRMNRLTEIHSVSGFDLVEFTTVSATVLSRPQLSDALRELFIDAGKSQGLTESQIVVDGAGLVIDRGERFGLKAGQKVTSGRAVVGRLHKVSRWVSLVQPVSDPQFSAAVQIVRLAPQGAAFGARGVLEGSDDGMCRITGIPYTSAVGVGDEVFSANIDGIQGPRLYFGRITNATFTQGGDWQIVVQPAVVAGDVEQVSVIHPVVNAGDRASLQGN